MLEPYGHVLRSVFNQHRWSNLKTTKAVFLLQVPGGVLLLTNIRLQSGRWMLFCTFLSTLKIGLTAPQHSKREIWNVDQIFVFLHGRVRVPVHNSILHWAHESASRCLDEKENRSQKGKICMSGQRHHSLDILSWVKNLFVFAILPWECDAEKEAHYPKFPTKKLVRYVFFSFDSRLGVSWRFQLHFLLWTSSNASTCWIRLMRQNKTQNWTEFADKDALKTKNIEKRSAYITTLQITIKKRQKINR